MKKILTLTWQWFSMIGEGIKLEEYREIKPYWMRQFLLYDGKPQRTVFIIKLAAICNA